MSKYKAFIRGLIFLPLIFYILFQVFFPLFFPFAFNRQMTLVVSILIALAVCLCIWLVLVYFSAKTISKILKFGLINGAISLVLGYVGPILLRPEANQGPLLGIFVTGPLGFIVGLVAGVIYWAFKKESRIE